MALTFQGISVSDIQSGIIVKVEMAASVASTTWFNVGDHTPVQLYVNGLTMPSDPSGSLLTYALDFNFSFSIVQTKKTAEIAAMAGTSGTGLYETDVLVRFTFMDGRVITLGAVATAPLRVTADYTNGSDEEAQRIDITGRTIEAITALAGKIA
jgi:hypothetical protein